MKKVGGASFAVVTAALLSLCSAGRTLGRDIPRAEVFGGYEILNVEVDGNERQNVNGALFSFSGNLTKKFGLETEGGFYHESFRQNAGTANVFSYLAGPVFSMRQGYHTRLFIHSLVGFDHTNGTEFGIPFADTAIAVAIGGGVEQRLVRRLGARAFFDFALSHSLTTQKNIRAGIGLTYRFGSLKNSTRIDADAQRVFQNKIECSKFLKYSPPTGPGSDASPSSASWAGKVDETLIVFYSPVFNTCLDIHLTLHPDQKQSNMRVTDLLTGKILEDHWLSSELSARSQDALERQIMERYGGTVP